MICIIYEIINFSKQKGGMFPLQHLPQLAVHPPPLPRSFPDCACSFPVGSGSAVSAVASPGQRDDRPKGDQTFLFASQENTFPKYIVKENKTKLEKAPLTRQLKLK